MAAGGSGVGGRGLQAALTVGLTAAVVAPVLFAVSLGMTPYEELLRTWPGYGVLILTVIAQALSEIAAVMSVGALVSVLFLRDLPGRKAFPVPAGVDLTILRWASGAWLVSTALLVPLSALDTSGVSFGQLADPGVVAYVGQAASNFWPSVLRFAAAALVALTARIGRSWTTLLGGLWGAGIAVLTPIVVGQVLVGPSHDFGGDAAVVQALVAYPVFGVLVVCALRALIGDDVPQLTWHRWLSMAVVGLPVAAGADLIVAWFKLAGSSLTASPTGWLILIRWVAILLVAAAAFTVARARHRLGAALTVGVLGASAWMAATVAMLREPPPQYFVPTSVMQIFLGFDTPDAPTIATVAGAWRPNVLFIAIAVAGTVTYLVAVSVLRRRGDSWPIGRTISWVLGWAVVAVVTSSGLGVYSAPHFGIHMIIHMSLSMLAPILLSLGGVLTLLLRASKAGRPAAGLHDWVGWVLQWSVAKLLYNPLVAFTLFISSYYGLYFTGLFESLMTYHWGHQLMNAHFLVVGYIYYSLIIGVDRGPKPLPHIAKLGLAMAAMPFHAFFGVILMNGRSIIAQDYYTRLGAPWANLPAAQELGGGVAWAGGEIPSLLVVIALGIQWARQDRKEAERIDRHQDSGRDTEYEEYNEMLQRLAEQAQRRND